MNQKLTKSRVAILICTCDRLSLLVGLLEAMRREVLSANFQTVSVVVVDNGEQSARKTVESFCDSLPIHYQRITEPGLVVARNASLKLALSLNADFLVFIDDDEAPNAGWLTNLVSTIVCTGADLVNGPVSPKFQSIPQPTWAIGFFSKSGSTYCTSNLIMRASILPIDEEFWFNPAFNFIGGEDKELLSRLVKNGAHHAIAYDAVVDEFIPTEKVTSSHVVHCGLRDGAVTVQMSLLNKYGSGFRHVYPITIILKKCAYGLYHLLWTLRGRDHYYYALRDFSTIVGIALSFSGRTFQFYGRR